MLLSQFILLIQKSLQKPLKNHKKIAFSFPFSDKYVLSFLPIWKKIASKNKNIVHKVPLIYI
jgi:hypothetical protein